MGINNSSEIYLFFGTTAEFIKLVPVIKELKSRKINYKILLSGQTDVNFQEFTKYIGDQKPYYIFKNKVRKPSFTYFLIWAIRTLVSGLYWGFGEFRDNHKAVVLVHGDTVTTLIGALIAKFYQVKLVHIESGLRSFRYFEPFPEEICRVIVSRIADIHFCPNDWAIKNLNSKGGRKINTLQNTLYETYLLTKKDLNTKKRLTGVSDNKYFVLVIHRQEHVVFNKAQGIKIINLILKNIPGTFKCVFVKHATTQNLLKSENFGVSRSLKNKIIFTGRLPYFEFLNLLKNSEFLITDGGSNQEEAYYLGLPTLILRNVTERIEGLGENVILSKMDSAKIVNFMKNYKTHKRSEKQFQVRPSAIIVDSLSNQANS